MKKKILVFNSHCSPCHNHEKKKNTSNDMREKRQRRRARERESKSQGEREEGWGGTREERFIFPITIPLRHFFWACLHETERIQLKRK